MDMRKTKGQKCKGRKKEGWIEKGKNINEFILLPEKAICKIKE